MIRRVRKRAVSAAAAVIASLWFTAPARAAATASVAAAPAGLVRGIRILPDKAPDCSSLTAIVESVTRGCTTNDEKAIAIYNFMRLTHYGREYPSEPGGISALKEINVYGWGLCGGLQAVQSALWRALGWEWRFVGWPGHTAAEAFYDGRWHYLDVFLKFYAWMPNPNHPGSRTIAGQDDLASRPQELLHDAFVVDEARKVAYARGNAFTLIGEQANWQAPAFLVCGDTIGAVAEGVGRKHNIGAVSGWGDVHHATGDYSADIDLAPGSALTNTWGTFDGERDAPLAAIGACGTCGDKDFRNSPEKGPVVEPYLGGESRCDAHATGQLVARPDLSHPDCLRAFAAAENVKWTAGALVPAEPGPPARITVRLQSPFILTHASGSADGVDLVHVSVDGGQTWAAVDLTDFSAAVRGQVTALVRFTFTKPLQALRLQATVQNNAFALPYLSPGRNTVTVSVADPASLGANTLVVTYAYRTGARRASYEQLCRQGNEIGRAHGAQWNTTPTVVQKTFSARDLPARFTIDVPTPRGRYAVYPRMLFVRREVVGPNQQTLPLPEGARPPSSTPGDELQTLPNPFLTGTHAPQPIRAGSASGHGLQAP